MDIQKEREAFEKYIQTVAHPHRSPKVMFFTVNDGHGNVIYCDISIQDQWETWLAAKAQAVSEGYVLISAEQLSQWGHMANYAEQYGCPECFEARGYAHSLACEINEFFAIEAQEPAND